MAERPTARRGRALDLARRLPVDPAFLREVVETLSALGSRPDGFRVTGTPEDRQAAELAAGHLRSAGLRDVAIERVTVDGWRLGDARLDLDGRSFGGASYGGAPGTPPGGVHAPLVDVGAGERRRLDRLQLEGRIAVLDWRSLAILPADVALELGRRGVAGIVLACSEGGPHYQATPGAVGGFDANWHAAAPPLLTLAREDAAVLRSAVRVGEPTGRLVVEVEALPGTDGHNTVGSLPGTEPGPPIVVGAHHDGWFTGSFDNATGVAVLLAIAKGLAELGHAPRHTLCFTSRTAEEYGLLESAYDWCIGAWGQITETHPEWRDSPFHLCLECSGHPGLRTVVEAPLELARWARSGCRAADAEGWLTAGWRVSGAPVTGTELWPYLVSGVPGLTTLAWETSFRSTTYHTPLDRPEIIDFDHLARVVRAYTLLLAEADADPDAIHDHRARSRQLGKVAAALGPDGDALAAAADRHASAATGRRPFTAIGRGLHAVDAAGEDVLPHAQALKDRDQLDTALAALEAQDGRAAVRALERVGANRLTRTLSAAAFAAREARRGPDGDRLAWGAASHLTASPDLWEELATLRGEDGARPPGAWLERSLREHRDAAHADLRRRIDSMSRCLAPEPLETT